MKDMNEYDKIDDMTVSERIAFSVDMASCNFIAVEEMRSHLKDMDFEELDLGREWSLRPGGRYFAVRNDTAIFAFICGSGVMADSGFHIIAAHSDSPGFKTKPSPEIYGEGGVVSLNVEKYGGAVMSTWFDRPLSIAARLMVRGDDPLNPGTVLVDLARPVAVIPNLAIHFNRQVNDGVKLSVQKDMKPVAGCMSRKEFDEYRLRGGLVKCLVADEAEINPGDIIGMECILYPCEATTIGVGVDEDLIVSPRLDDLSMAFAAIEAITMTADADVKATRVAAIFDNEETGSGTRQGAAAPTLRNILERITMGLERGEHEKMMADERALDCVPAAQQEYRYNPESFFRALEHTFLISADDAHAWHPNYGDKYDPEVHALIGHGPVVKINSNCKYMTDPRGAAVFRALCEKVNVNCQYFVNHGDVAGGSTLGNILTSQLDIAGVDMGCAIWAMHSAAETGSMRDLDDTVKVFCEFYRS